jgi:RiboL-PSP-HEPN
MNQAFSQFKSNIEEVRKIHLISTSISVPTSSIVDTSSILRSCIVLSVSAIDHLVHELTIIGMKQIFSGTRPVTTKYNNHNVSLGFINAITSMPPLVSFDSEIRKSLGWQTFQRPDKIKDAIALFNPIQLWQQVALTMCDTEINVKNQLNLIVDRRNMIAHEADIEPIFKTKRTISDTDVVVTINFIENLGTSIYNLVR